MYTADRPLEFLSLHEATAAVVRGTKLLLSFRRKWKSFAISHFSVLVLPTRRHLRDEIYLLVTVVNCKEWLELKSRLHLRDSSVAAM